MTPARSPQARAAVELLRNTLEQLDGAIRANTAHADMLTQQRTELFRLRREVSEALDEFTPVRPPSRDDVKAAFVTSSAFPGKAET